MTGSLVNNELGRM